MGDRDEHYIPGVCNIGKSETKRREQAGWLGVITAVILYSLIVYLNAPRLWRLIIFIPAAIAAIGFLQARMHFCAYFGMRGVFNFSPYAGETETIDQVEFRAADRRRAWLIIIYSAVIGAMVAAAAYYLPP
ncbi:MAG: hypothetical protein OIN66_13495 [Candidatus Methanoperedens sp.]|nr:hypothetical protein [Candidatus Methanoperedens sp.]